MPTEYNEALEDMELFVLNAMSYLQTNYGGLKKDIEDKDIKTITPQSFLREYAWVVYASGFKVEILAKKWKNLSSAYFNFDPIRIPTSAEDFAMLRQKVFEVIAHQNKFKAIMVTMMLVKKEWEILKRRVLTGRIDDLKQLGYIGNVTKYHLARNLGICDTGKPDIHIVRLSKHFGYNSPMKFIDKAAEIAKVKRGIVDLAMWAYASDHGTKDLIPNEV